MMSMLKFENTSALDAALSAKVSGMLSAAIETEAGNNAYASMFRSEFIEMSAGDYVEAFFAVDNVALFLHAAAATAFAPASPSAHLAVTQVS